MKIQDVFDFVALHHKPHARRIGLVWAIQVKFGDYPPVGIGRTIQEAYCDWFMQQRVMEIGEMSYGVLCYPEGDKRDDLETLESCDFIARDNSIVFGGHWFVASFTTGNQLVSIIHCYSHGYRQKHMSAFPDGTTQLEAIEILNRLWHG